MLLISIVENPIYMKAINILLFMIATVFFTIGLFHHRKLFFGFSIILLIVYGYINIHFNNIEMLWIILSLMGVGLLIIEALVPGVQVFGIVGLIFLIIGLIQSQDSLFYGILTLFLSLIACLNCYFYQKKKGRSITALNKLVLNDKNTSEKGYLAIDFKNLVGKEGVTTSTLRPTGYGEIDGRKYDLYAEEGFIKEGEAIVVIGEKSMKVLVRRK